MSTKADTLKPEQKRFIDYQQIYDAEADASQLEREKKMADQQKQQMAFKASTNFLSKEKANAGKGLSRNELRQSEGQ